MILTLLKLIIIKKYILGTSVSEELFEYVKSWSIKNKASSHSIVMTALRVQRNNTLRPLLLSATPHSRRYQNIILHNLLTNINNSIMDNDVFPLIASKLEQILTVVTLNVDKLIFERRIACRQIDEFMNSSIYKAAYPDCPMLCISNDLKTANLTPLLRTLQSVQSFSIDEIYEALSVIGSIILAMDEDDFIDDSEIFELFHSIEPYTNRQG